MFLFLSSVILNEKCQISAFFSIFYCVFSHLTLITPQQLYFSIGLALELQLSSRLAPAEACTRSSSRGLSAHTQAQLSIITSVVLCRLAHLQEGNQRTKQILFIYILLGCNVQLCFKFENH